MLFLFYNFFYSTHKLLLYFSNYCFDNIVVIAFICLLLFLSGNLIYHSQNLFINKTVNQTVDSCVIKKILINYHKDQIDIIKKLFDDPNIKTLLSNDKSNLTNEEEETNENDPETNYDDQDPETNEVEETNEEYPETDKEDPETDKEYPDETNGREKVQNNVDKIKKSNIFVDIPKLPESPEITYFS
jgi:hypothetical protein